MADLPRKARETDGVSWAVTSHERGYALHATYNVGKQIKQLRAWFPGSAVLDQAARLIQGRINQQRYAAMH